MDGFIDNQKNASTRGFHLFVPGNLQASSSRSKMSIETMGQNLFFCERAFFVYSNSAN